MGGSLKKKPLRALGLFHEECSSADSVIQRLHSRQLKILSSTKPFVPGTVRATRKAPPQPGANGLGNGLGQRLLAGRAHRFLHHRDALTVSAATQRRCAVRYGGWGTL